MRARVVQSSQWHVITSKSSTNSFSDIPLLEHQMAVVVSIIRFFLKTRIDEGILAQRKKNYHSDSLKQSRICFYKKNLPIHQTLCITNYCKISKSLVRCTSLTINNYYDHFHKDFGKDQCLNQFNQSVSAYVCRWNHGNFCLALIRLARDVKLCKLLSDMELRSLVNELLCPI